MLRELDPRAPRIAQQVSIGECAVGSNFEHRELSVRAFFDRDPGGVGSVGDRLVDPWVDARDSEKNGHARRFADGPLEHDAARTRLRRQKSEAGVASVLRERIRASRQRVFIIAGERVAAVVVVDVDRDRPTNLTGRAEDGRLAVHRNQRPPMPATTPPCTGVTATVAAGSLRAKNQITAVAKAAAPTPSRTTPAVPWVRPERSAPASVGSSLARRTASSVLAPYGPARSNPRHLYDVGVLGKSEVHHAAQPFPSRPRESVVSFTPIIALNGKPIPVALSSKQATPAEAAAAPHPVVSRARPLPREPWRRSCAFRF